MYRDRREKPEREPDNLQGRKKKVRSLTRAELSSRSPGNQDHFFSHPQRLYEKHETEASIVSFADRAGTSFARMIVMTKSKLY